jgi:hypothetical protein
VTITTHETLAEIMRALKSALPGLKKLLDDGGPAEVLHPVIEMTGALVARYERGEIVEQEFSQEM